MADDTQTQDPQPAATGTPPPGNTEGQDAARITLTEAQLAERLKRKEQQVLERIQKEQADKDAAAEQSRLKEQGKYEALLKDLEPKLQTVTAERDAVVAERDALRQHVSDHVTRQIKDWPADFKNLVPDTDDALARWKGYETASGLYQKYGAAGGSGGGGTRVAGNSPGPRSAGNGPPKSLVDQELDRLGKSGLFSRG